MTWSPLRASLIRSRGRVAALLAMVMICLLPACRKASTASIVSSLPADATVANISFDGRIQLAGYQLEPARLIPGEDARLTLYFKPLQPLEGKPGALKLLTHLSRACAGKNVFMLEQDLGGSGFALADWKPGELLKQDAVLEVPGDIRSPTAAVWVALARGKPRLKIDGDQRVDRRNRLRLADVAVDWQPPVAPPAYPVQRAIGPIAIDGKLDEPDWKRAPSTGYLVQTDGNAISEERTQARLLWDDTHLYVAFEVEDRDLYSTYTAHDQPLYEQAVVELYLDPDGDGRTYYELQVSPANVSFDVYYPECRQDMDLTWESGMRSAVQLDGTLNASDDEDRGMTVELAVPFASIRNAPHLPPQTGDRWRGNLYRLDKRGRDHKKNVGSSWGPTFVGDYHTPSAWGTFEFVGGG